ncbi:MAG: AAA family ATPase [Candidatus Helarchaeota archaeon]
MKKCPKLIEETHFGQIFFKCGITKNALDTEFCEGLCLKNSYDECDYILDPNKLQFKGKWKEIIGLDHVKIKLIEDVQIPFLFPEKNLIPVPVIILFGPDGCGKSKLVQILAEESKAKLIMLNPRNIDSISSHLLQCEGPTIFVVDEIDIVAPAAEDRDIFTSVFRMQDPMISLMDGINNIKNSKKPAVLIGVSDSPELLSPMLLKQEYVSEIIYVNPPDLNSRKLILKDLLKDKPLSKDVNFDELAEQTKNYSIYDLKKLIKNAEIDWIKKSWKEDAEINMEDFNQAFRETVPSITTSILTKFETTARKYGALEKGSKEKILTWDDLGGYKSVKEQLQNIENIIKRNKMAIKYKLRSPKGILLFGPPGCGKTYIAKILAATTDSNFQYVSAPDLLSKWVGESEKNLRDLFNIAKINAPSILFFDELDGLAFERSRTTDHPYLVTMISTFLSEISSLNEDDQVLVIGATNRPEDIDPAFLRPGRFDERIAIPPPDENARKEIFSIHLRDLPLTKNIDLKELARITKGYTCAEIEYICESTQRTVAFEAMKKNSFKKINMEDILIQIRNIKPDLSEDDIKRFQEICERFERRGVVTNIKRIDEISFDDIADMGKVKEFFKKNLLISLVHPKETKEYGLPAKKGIILFGPSGIGKSLLSKALVKESKANYFIFSALELTNWFSIRESRKKFHELMHDAERVAPSIIVLQNLELIPREVAVFITNEFEKVKKEAAVILICETSDLSKIGDILQSSFDYIVPILPPTQEERLEIFQKLASQFPTEKDLDFIQLSKMSKYFVGGDILKVFRGAAQDAIQRKLAKDPKSLIQNNDLLNNLKNTKPVLSQKYIEEFYRQLKIIGVQKLPFKSLKDDLSLYG